VTCRAFRFQVDAWRGDRVESQHVVHVAALGTPALGAAEVDPASLPHTCMRSTAKPLQLLPLVARGGAARIGFEAADLALMAASHDGTLVHAARTRSILSRLGASPAALRCGLHRPYFLDDLPADDPARAHMYGALHHNCSGNHAAMLAQAQLAGVELADYLDPDCASQRLMHTVVHALADEAPVILLDNCNAPCYDLSLPGIAAAYASLADPASLRRFDAARSALLASVAPLDACVAALEAIGTAMATCPEWLTGETTPSTRLARSLQGSLVLKHGAEGMLCAAFLDRRAAIALKVADGSARAAMPVLLHLLHAFGWQRDAPGLLDLQEPVLRGNDGQVVGCLRVRAPM